MDTKTLKTALAEMTGGPVKVRKGSASAGNRFDIFLPKSIRLDPVRLHVLMGEVQRMTGRVPFMEAIKTPGRIAPNFHILPLHEDLA